VELAVSPTAFVSVADAARATVAPGDGRGITLSWRVADVDATRAALLADGVAVGPVGTRFGSRVADVHDPAGNRIELWS
jgi:predicted enzyme related to lactoylglutathione lyase